LGGHKVEASLDDVETKAYAAWPISFHLPEIPKRLIHTPLNFVVAASTESGTKLRGIFVDGRWEAHVYTNGIAEEENPTKIDDVKRELEESIAASVKLAVDAYAQTVK
jgi:hypothetical protein